MMQPYRRAGSPLSHSSFGYPSLFRRSLGRRHRKAERQVRRVALQFGLGTTSSWLLLGVHVLPDEVSGSRLAVAGHGGHTDGNELASIERAHIVEVLTREGGNKARAARALGINRRSLYRLIDKYEIRMTRETEQAH